MKEMIWLDIFKTEIIPDDMCEDEARAIAYSAWGNCLAGSTPPESFGRVLAALTIKYPSVGDIALNIGKEAPHD